MAPLELSNANREMVNKVMTWAKNNRPAGGESQGSRVSVTDFIKSGGAAKARELLEQVSKRSESAGQANTGAQAVGTGNPVEFGGFGTPEVKARIEEIQTRMKDNKFIDSAKELLEKGVRVSAEELSPEQMEKINKLLEQLPFKLGQRISDIAEAHTTTS